MTRLILGLLVAPLTPGLFFLCLSLFGNIKEGFWAVGMSAVVGYPSAIIFGLPAHFLLHKARMTKLVFYALVGAVIGFILGLGIFFATISGMYEQNFSTESVARSAIILLISGFLGASASTVFWIIARPDRL
jgi:hypothetical protein